MSTESRLRKLEREVNADAAPPAPAVDDERPLVLIYDPRVGPPEFGPGDVQPMLMLPDNGRSLTPTPEAGDFGGQDIPTPSAE